MRISFSFTKGISLFIIVILIGVGSIPNFSGKIEKKEISLNSGGIPPREEWNRLFYFCNERGKCVHQTVDGGYIITGTTPNITLNPWGNAQYSGTSSSSKTVRISK